MCGRAVRILIARAVCRRWRPSADSGRRNRQQGCRVATSYPFAAYVESPALEDDEELLDEEPLDEELLDEEEGASSPRRQRPIISSTSQPL